MGTDGNVGPQVICKIRRHFSTKNACGYHAFHLPRDPGRKGREEIGAGFARFMTFRRMT